MEEYELKSKGGSISNKISGGAYNTMIERITSVNNLNFSLCNIVNEFASRKFCYGT